MRSVTVSLSIFTVMTLSLLSSYGAADATRIAPATAHVLAASRAAIPWGVRAATCNSVRRMDDVLLRLTDAAGRGDIVEVRALLDAGCPVQATAPRARRTREATPLLMACYGARAEVVAELLARGADVHARDSRGRTPLHAVAAFHPALGILMSSTNAMGGSYQRIAKGTHDCTEARVVAEQLVARGATVDDRDDRGATPIAIAAECGNRAVADVLIRNGAGVAFHDAVFLCDMRRVSDMLSQDARIVDTKDWQGRRPLLLAAEVGWVSGAMVLISHGANPNAAWVDGLRPIHQAILHDNTDVLRVLLSSGADPDAHAIRGGPRFRVKSSALDLAFGGPEMTRLLIEHGAEFNICHVAAAGDAGRVMQLIGKDPRVLSSRIGPSGYAALHAAVLGGQEKLVSLLLDAGADINQRSKADGWTPLHCAAYEGDSETARVLLVRGADVSITSETGETAEELALYKGRGGIAEEIGNYRKRSGPVQTLP